ncbi:hypothetical protein BC832DRAFT_457707 [Gaertneriomyces semiglobifer]|nr:hypothetical protein BC832DRAFT_457707 [Gaertneriomyces semiglobifer]
MELILKGQNRTVTDMHQYCHLEAMVDSVEEENGHHEQQQHLHLQVWPTDAGGTLYPQTLIDHNSHSQGVDFISSNSPYGHHSYPPQPYSQQYPLRQQPPQSYTPLSHTPPSYDQHRQQRNRRISEESIHFSSPDASAKRDWISRSPTLPLRRSSFTGSPYREITYSNYPLVPWEDPGPSYLSYNSPSNHAVDPSLLHDLHTLAAAAVAVPSRSRFPTGENDIYLESPLTSPSHKRHQRLESAGYDRPVTNAVRRTNQKGDRQNMAVSADMPSHHVQGPSFTNPNKRRASPASQESAESGEDSFRSPKPNNLRGHFEATAPVIEGPSTGDMVSENSELERPRYDGHVPLRTLR